MIFAKLRLGPDYAPNGNTIVELISQCPPPARDFFLVKFSTGETHPCHGSQLTLIWNEPS